jgi:predicted DNA-binding WGR domain protein
MTMKRHYKYIGGGHDKFWQIEVAGNRTIVTWGRNGTKGTTLAKEWLSESSARVAAMKQVMSKLKGGYVEYEWPYNKPMFAKNETEKDPEVVVCEL